MLYLFILFIAVGAAVIITHRYVPHLSGRIGILLLLLGMLLTVVLHPKTVAHVQEILTGSHTEASQYSSTQQALSFSELIALQHELNGYVNEQHTLKQEILSATTTLELRHLIDRYKQVSRVLDAKQQQIKGVSIDLRSAP